MPSRPLTMSQTARTSRTTQPSSSSSSPLSPTSTSPFAHSRITMPGTWESAPRKSPQGPTNLCCMTLLAWPVLVMALWKLQIAWSKQPVMKSWTLNDSWSILSIGTNKDFLTFGTLWKTPRSVLRLITTSSRKRINFQSKCTRSIMMSKWDMYYDTMTQ